MSVNLDNPADNTLDVPTHRSKPSPAYKYSTMELLVEIQVRISLEDMAE